LALGRTVRELEITITENELVEWMAFYQIDPFGEWREDLRNAQLCALLAEINRDRKKKSSPYKIADFMLFMPPKKKQSAEELKAALMQLVKSKKEKR